MRFQTLSDTPLTMLATGRIEVTDCMVGAISHQLHWMDHERFPDALAHAERCFLSGAFARLVAAVEHYLVTHPDAHGWRTLCRTQGGMKVAETSTSRLLRFLRSDMMFRATMAG